MKVPLIIYDPDIKGSGKKIDNLVELVDIFPTLVDLAQLSQIQPCTLQNSITCTEGKSLKNLMKGDYDSYTDSAAYSQYPRPGTYPTLKPNSDEPKLKDIKIMGYSIKTNRFRYTVWLNFNRNTFKAGKN